MTATLEAPPQISPSERRALFRTVAVTTGKGGILKTSTVCSIAVAAARRGMRVLVVDMDSQGTASRRDLGLEGDERYDDGASMADALLDTFTKPDREAARPQILQGVATYPQDPGPDGTARPHGAVDVVTGGRKLEATMDAISVIATLQRRSYTHVLGKVLATVASGYHLVLIDNDPKVKSVRTMVLEAAAFSYAPIDFDIAAYADGLSVLTEEIAEARQNNPDHLFLGAVAGRIPDQSIRAWRKLDKHGAPKPGGEMVNIAAIVRPILRNPAFDPERAVLGEEYPKIFTSMVRYSVLQVAKARKSGQTIADYVLEQAGPGADMEKVLEKNKILQDYDELMIELITAMGAAQNGRAAIA